MATIGADWSGLWRGALQSWRVTADYDSCACCRDVDLTLSHEQMFWPVAPASSFPKPFLSFTSSLSFSLHLLFTCFFFFHFSFPSAFAYYYPTLFPCSLGEWQIWQVLCLRSLYFHNVWSSAVAQISLAVSAITTAVFTWLAILLTWVIKIANKAVLICLCNLKKTVCGRFVGALRVIYSE